MIWALVTLLLNTIAQVLLKLSTKNSGSILAWLPALNWSLVSALLLYALSVVTWLQALKLLPLAVAYPFMAAALITVPVAAAFFFKETLSLGQWAFLGLALFGLIGFTAISK